MAEHTFNIPARQETTRFDNGDELQFRAASDNMSELAAARALVAHTEAVRQERLAEQERTPQKEMLAIGQDLAAARSERLAA